MLVPERISPPEASGAPESRLPVCELWMLPFRASALYRPRMKSIFSRKSVERREHLAQLHRLALALGPPLLAVEAVAREEDGQPHRRLAGAAPPAGSSPQTRQRLQPGQGHRHAERRGGTCGGRSR